MIKIKDDALSFQKLDKNKQKNILFAQQYEMKHCVAKDNTNSFANFSKYESSFLKYSDIINNIDLRIFEDFIHSQIDENFDFEFHEDSILQSFMRSVKKYNNIFLFFPSKLDQDILSNKNYLTGINKYKFQRANIDLKNQITKFYDLYGLNSRASLDLFKLEDYFYYSGNIFKDYFAYFDPFKMLNVYNEQFSYLIATVKEKEKFIFELFDLFNWIQFNSVVKQHENLINSIGLAKYYNRFNEFIEKQIEIVTSVEESSSKQLFLDALYVLYEKYSQLNGNFSKNTTIENLGLESCEKELKDTIQYIIEIYQKYR